MICLIFNGPFLSPFSHGCMTHISRSLYNNISTTGTTCRQRQVPRIFSGAIVYHIVWT